MFHNSSAIKDFRKNVMYFVIGFLMKGESLSEQNPFCDAGIAEPTVM
jgi:hypothetical protein